MFPPYGRSIVHHCCLLESGQQSIFAWIGNGNFSRWPHRWCLIDYISFPDTTHLSLNSTVSILSKTRDQLARFDALIGILQKQVEGPTLVGSIAACIREQRAAERSYHRQPFINHQAPSNESDAMHGILDVALRRGYRARGPQGAELADVELLRRAVTYTRPCRFSVIEKWRAVGIQFGLNELAARSLCKRFAVDLDKKVAR
jgi:hypothetical protein